MCDSTDIAEGDFVLLHTQYVTEPDAWRFYAIVLSKHLYRSEVCAKIYYADGLIADSVLLTSLQLISKCGV